MNDTDFEGFVKREGGPIENVDFDQVVTKDYFSTMGIRLMEGRLFDDRDTAAGTPVGDCEQHDGSDVLAKSKRDWEACAAE